MAKFSKALLKQKKKNLFSEYTFNYFTTIILLKYCEYFIGKVGSNNIFCSWVKIFFESIQKYYVFQVQYLEYYPKSAGGHHQQD